MNAPQPDPLSDLISTFAAAELLGVAEAYFTEAADAAGFEAAVPGSKTQPRQWRRAEVLAFGDGPHGVEMRATVIRDGLVEAEAVALAAKYAGWKAAAGEAAAAMFQFNRYVKWATCSHARRKELYTLKGRFIRALCAGGFCVAVVEHAAQVGADEDGDGEPDETREFLAFKFRIDDQPFSWHLPKHQVSWSYTLSEPEAEAAMGNANWRPKAGPKPVSLDAAEFVAAEALIRFVLAGHAADETAERERAKQERAARMRAEGLARQAELRKQEGEST